MLCRCRGCSLIIEIEPDSYHVVFLRRVIRLILLTPFFTSHTYSRLSHVSPSYILARLPCGVVAQNEKHDQPFSRPTPLSSHIPRDPTDPSGVLGRPCDPIKDLVELMNLFGSPVRRFIDSSVFVTSAYGGHALVQLPRRLLETHSSTRPLFRSSSRSEKGGFPEGGGKIIMAEKVLLT